jgi:hypothetical protein
MISSKERESKSMTIKRYIKDTFTKEESMALENSKCKVVTIMESSKTANFTEKASMFGSISITMDNGKTLR